MAYSEFKSNVLRKSVFNTTFSHVIGFFWFKQLFFRVLKARVSLLLSRNPRCWSKQSNRGSMLEHQTLYCLCFDWTRNENYKHVSSTRFKNSLGSPSSDHSPAFILPLYLSPHCLNAPRSSQLHHVQRTLQEVLGVQPQRGDTDLVCLDQNSNLER